MYNVEIESKDFFLINCSWRYIAPHHSVVCIHFIQRRKIKGEGGKGGREGGREGGRRKVREEMEGGRKDIFLWLLWHDLTD